MPKIDVLNSDIPASRDTRRRGFLHLLDPGFAQVVCQINQQYELDKNKQETASQSKIHPNTVEKLRLGYHQRTYDQS